MEDGCQNGIYTITLFNIPAHGLYPGHGVRLCHAAHHPVRHGHVSVAFHVHPGTDGGELFTNSEILRFGLVLDVILAHYWYNISGNDLGFCNQPLAGNRCRLEGPQLYRVFSINGE